MKPARHFIVEPGRFRYDIETIRMTYSFYGRIAHQFIGAVGPSVMDDHGNSVKTTNNQLAYFARQEH